MLARTDVRSVNSRVTTRAPTRPQREIIRVVYLADKNPATRSRHLRMTLEAKIIVRLDQHLRVDRAVRIVTNDATFAHRLMFKDKRPGLIAMASGTGLIESRQPQPAGGFHDVVSMRIVTLDTIHFAFDHRMMLWQRKLRMRFEVALETGRSILARIQDEPPATTADFDVFAARTVAGFAAALADACVGRELHPGVRTGGENADVVGVALKTGFVADVIGPRNGRAHHDRSGRGGAGVHRAQNQEP